MKFRTQYDGDTGKFTSECGSPYFDEYEYRVSKAGVKELVMKDEKTNLHDKIQADYPSTDINLLMKRFALGDSSAIQIRDGVYIDASKMPSTYAELFDRVEVAKQEFDKLPVDLKQMFDNSYSVFWSEYGTKSFNSKIDEPDS